MNEFEKLGIDEDFNGFYKEHKIKTPTEVQKRVIPTFLAEKSTLCLSQTGTGKTLGFALPMSELIKRIEDEHGVSQTNSAPYGVIIAPTKELAMQIHSVFKDISHHVKLRVRTLVGVTKTKSTLGAQKYEILIATPTKLARSVKRGEVNLKNTKYLVFDEADNLFEMGFKKDIESILYPINFEKTNIHFFSATMPPEVEAYLQEKFKKVKFETITMSEAHKVQQRVETYNIFVKVEEKQQMLKEFFKKTANGRGIIFCNQKNQIGELEEYLKAQVPDLKVSTLHGNLSEKERIKNHKDFNDRKAQVLIATDVAARGIDIKGLNWILNFYLPKTPIYYLHRCGRTARAGSTGIVYNFVTTHDAKIIANINESIKKQTEMSIEVIASTLKDVRRKSKPAAPAKKGKTKRVKVTKRTKRDQR